MYNLWKKFLTLIISAVFVVLLFGSWLDWTPFCVLCCNISIFKLHRFCVSVCIFYSSFIFPSLHHLILERNNYGIIFFLGILFSSVVPFPPIPSPFVFSFLTITHNFIVKESFTHCICITSTYRISFVFRIGNWIF